MTTATKKLTVKELVCEISEFAKKHPWVQHQRVKVLDSGNTAYCMLGYIDTVCARNGVHASLYPSANRYDRVLRIIGEAVRKRYPKDSIISFNDSGKTRKRDVIVVLDEACKQAVRRVK